MEFVMEIRGERRVGLRFEQFPQEAYSALFTAIDELIAELFDRVMASIPRRSGALADALTYTVRGYPDRIAGYVGFGKSGENPVKIFAQAAALEYGAHTKGMVKAHRFQLDHVFSHAIEPMMVMIKEAYSRTPDIVEHAFLRGSLSGMDTQIIMTMQAALDSVTANLSEAA